MKDKHSNFHDSIMKFKENHTKIKINKFEIVKIQEAVLHVLKLKDLNKLRDKFDGVVYYEKFLRDTICEIAIEKLLKKKIIDWESKKIKKDTSLHLSSMRRLQKLFLYRTKNTR